MILFEILWGFSLVPLCFHINSFKMQGGVKLNGYVHSWGFFRQCLNWWMHLSGQPLPFLSCGPLPCRYQSKKTATSKDWPVKYLLACWVINLAPPPEIFFKTVFSLYFFLHCLGQPLRSQIQLENDQNLFCQICYSFFTLGKIRQTCISSCIHFCFVFEDFIYIFQKNIS